MYAIPYKRAIKLKAKEVFKANCGGKRYSDIEYSDGIIGAIYDKDSADVWNDIEYFANVYHECLALKNMEVIGEVVKPFLDSFKGEIKELHV